MDTICEASTPFSEVLYGIIACWNDNLGYWHVFQANRYAKTELLFWLKLSERTSQAIEKQRFGANIILVGEKAVLRYWGSVIYVEDVPTTMRFYEIAFGFTTRFYDEAAGFGELEADDAVFAFATHELGRKLMPGCYDRSDDAPPSRIEIAFVADDVPGVFKRAVEAGAVSITEPTVMAWGATIAYLRSIEGTLIGLTTPVR